MTSEKSDPPEIGHVCYNSVEDLFYLSAVQETLLRRLLNGLDSRDREIMVGIIQQFANPNIF